MPRPPRLDFKGAYQLAHISGRAELQIFFSPASRAAARVRQLEDIISAACDECGATLCAYRIECNACVLLVHIGGSSLDALMQRICGQYSRYLHSNNFVPKGNLPFVGRYESKVIAPTYLPHAVRRLHSQSLGRFAFDSGAAYLGGRGQVPLDLTTVRELLKNKGYPGLMGYKAFIAERENPYVSNLFDRGSPLDHRIVGDRAFVIQAHAAAAHPPIPPTLEQLSLGVARLLQRDVEELYASTHLSVLGRSLVAWYALRTGAATLTETGKWFSVSAAALGQGMRHHRSVSPELFSQAALLLEGI